MFRKRHVSLILATDPSRHIDDLTAFKNRRTELGISLENGNADKFIDKTDDSTLYDTQEQLMNILIHAADVSPPTR